MSRFRWNTFSPQMLPELRTDLFGKNENRKFYTVSDPLFSIGHDNATSRNYGAQS